MYVCELVKLSSGGILHVVSAASVINGFRSSNRAFYRWALMYVCVFNLAYM